MFGLDIGSSAHADDIRGASNFTHATHVQGNCIYAFCASNSLTLNASKTETITFSIGPLSPGIIEVTCIAINT